MMAAQMCQQGNPRACGPAQWFTQYSTGLAQDFQTCQRGFQPACASYSQRALQAQEGIQQFMNTFVEGQGTQP